MELVEDPCPLLGGDAEALVEDMETNAATDGLGSKLNVPAIGRILDRVLDQIEQNLSDLVPIGSNEEVRIGEANINLNVLGSMDACGLSDAVEQIVGIEWLGFEIHAPDIELVGEQDLVDDSPQPFGFFDDQMDQRSRPASSRAKSCRSRVCAAP